MVAMATHTEKLKSQELPHLGGLLSRRRATTIKVKADGLKKQSTFMRKALRKEEVQLYSFGITNASSKVVIEVHGWSSGGFVESMPGIMHCRRARQPEFTRRRHFLVEGKL